MRKTSTVSWCDVKINFWCCKHYFLMGLSRLLSLNLWPQENGAEKSLKTLERVRTLAHPAPLSQSTGIFFLIGLMSKVWNKVSGEHMHKKLYCFSLQHKLHLAFPHLFILKLHRIFKMMLTNKQLTLTENWPGTQNKIMSDFLRNNNLDFEMDWQC